MPTSSPTSPIRWCAGLALAAVLAEPALAADDPARFRAVYEELVETDTSLSTGSCTAAAEKTAARLHTAGYSAGEARLIVPEKFPRQGNLVVRVAGSDPSLEPVLFLAHIDVVEAKRADWKRDPFTLVEEDGYFFARGAVDDKAMAAAFVDALLRFREEGFRPKRSIKVALTCGEETDSVFNGVQHLLATEPETLRAAFAINEGGKALLDEEGGYKLVGVEAGQKIYQDFRLVATAPGGHSARPVGENAIARLSAALVRINEHEFPVELIEASRTFFGRSAPLYEGQMQADMAAIGAGRADAAAYARIASADPLWNAMLRTTCVVTLVNGGHAENALPQHAEANVNCRLLPGQTVGRTLDRLRSVVNDPKVEIDLAEPPGPASPPPPLTPAVLAPIEQAAAAVWPGVPVIPSLSTGATDGRFLTAAGIPTYGVSGMFVDPDGNGVHGLDERIRVRSLMEGRAFLYRLMKAYASGANRPS